MARLPFTFQNLDFLREGIMLREVLSASFEEAIGKCDTLRYDDGVIVLTLNQAEELSQSDEMKQYVAQMPSHHSVRFGPFGLPDRIYGLPVEILPTPGWKLNGPSQPPVQMWKEANG